MLTALSCGIAAGFVLAWARLTDPAVIRDMLLLREAHVFLVMGSAVAVATIGVRLLRAAGARAFITGEPIRWSVDRPRARHLFGSALFAIGWTVAGTCPGPVAAMIGEGKLGGMVVAGGLVGGVALQGALARRWSARVETLPSILQPTRETATGGSR
jgi:uncharacterized membrane protein YedE/YeeE